MVLQVLERALASYNSLHIHQCNINKHCMQSHHSRTNKKTKHDCPSNRGSFQAHLVATLGMSLSSASAACKHKTVLQMSQTSQVITNDSSDYACDMQASVCVRQAVAHLDEESKVGKHSQPANTINQLGACCTEISHDDFCNPLVGRIWRFD